MGQLLLRKWGNGWTAITRNTEPSEWADNTFANSPDYGIIERLHRRFNREGFMDEKIYKMLGRAGRFNLVMGIVSIAIGVAAGTLLIISGARLLTGKSRVLI